MATEKKIPLPVGTCQKKKVNFGPWILHNKIQGWAWWWQWCYFGLVERALLLVRTTILLTISPLLVTKVTFEPRKWLKLIYSSQERDWDLVHTINRNCYYADTCTCKLVIFQEYRYYRIGNIYFFFVVPLVVTSITSQWTAWVWETGAVGRSREEKPGDRPIKW